MYEAINTGDIELWTERLGQGPEVLLKTRGKDGENGGPSYLLLGRTSQKAD